MAAQQRLYRKTKREQDQQLTRTRILHAGRDAFFSRPYEEVTLGAVAAAAETTVQTVLNHFRSKENLLVAVAEFMRPEVEKLRGRTKPRSTAEAIDGLMQQYESTGDANVRLVAAADRFADLHAAIEVGREAHRQWLEWTFASRLPAEQSDRSRHVGALYAATDVGTWKLLRRDLGYSAEETAAILSLMVESSLAGGS